VDDSGQQEPSEQAAPVAPQAAEPTYAGRGFVSLALIVGGIGFLAYRVYPAHHHRLPARHNFINEVFANNLVLFAARLTLLSGAVVLAVAAVFIVISFYQRGKAGHWMARFGPFETQAVEDLAGQMNQWIEWWQEENARAEELQVRVEESEALMGEVYAALEAAQTEIAILKGEDAPTETP
jgi:hypothetical protein